MDLNELHQKYWRDLPLGATLQDRQVGITEFGLPVYESQLGHQYSYDPSIQANEENVGLSTKIVNALAGIPSGIWDAIEAPGRSLMGETVTNGSAWDVAGIAQLGSAAMPAPRGSVRSGALRNSKGAAAGRSQADEIMGMLRDGRGSQVTDEMMNAADQAYLSSIYDLPMDEASRMHRAQDLGYRTGMPLYHGTATDFPSFDMSHAGDVTRNQAAKQAVWLADDPAVANEFAQLAGNARKYADNSSPQVLPVFHKADRPASGRLPMGATNDSVAITIDDAFSGGMDAVRLQDYTTPSGEVGKNIFAIKSPDQIRSRFARFDPRLAHLRHLSAGIGAGGLTMNALAPGYSPDDEEILQYLIGLQ